MVCLNRYQSVILSKTVNTNKFADKRGRIWILGESNWFRDPSLKMLGKAGAHALHTHTNLHSNEDRQLLDLEYSIWISSIYLSIHWSWLWYPFLFQFTKFPVILFNSLPPVCATGVPLTCPSHPSVTCRPPGWVFGHYLPRCVSGRGHDSMSCSLDSRREDAPSTWGYPPACLGEAGLEGLAQRKAQ